MWRYLNTESSKNESLPINKQSIEEKEKKKVYNKMPHKIEDRTPVGFLIYRTSSAGAIALNLSTSN